MTLFYESDPSGYYYMVKCDQCGVTSEIGRDSNEIPIGGIVKKKCLFCDTDLKDRKYNKDNEIKEFSNSIVTDPFEDMEKIDLLDAVLLNNSYTTLKETEKTAENIAVVTPNNDSTVEKIMAVDEGIEKVSQQEPKEEQKEEWKDPDKIVTKLKAEKKKRPPMKTRK